VESSSTSSSSTLRSSTTGCKSATKPYPFIHLAWHHTTLGFLQQHQRRLNIIVNMGVLGSLIPLVILFSVIGGFGWFGYQIYLYSQDLAEHGKKHMKKKNISFTQDGGLSIGVKEVRSEDYEDSTQRAFVKTWNLANESQAEARRASSTHLNAKPSLSRGNSGASGRSQQ